MGISCRKYINVKYYARHSLFITLLLAITIAIPTGTANATSYSFVSMPDFLNADVGDVSSSPYYIPGNPNSTNESYQAALATVLNGLASEGIPDVLIAGDFVEGHWGIDTANTGTFGPVDTEENAVQAVRNAAGVYYPQGLERFTSRGLTVYPSVGDHEIGDNPWGPSSGTFAGFKHRNMSTFKSEFSKYYYKNSDGTDRFVDHPSGQAAGTSYAVRLDPEVQLISLDVFRKTSTTIIPSLDTAQLTWLESVLKQANADGVDWIIVQGHTPILGPVRSKSSSKLMYQGGVNSPLWKMMTKYKVDLYLCGEVHDITARYGMGITQISHGGLAYNGDANYLIGTITDNRLNMTVKRFTGGIADRSQKMWQTDMAKAKPISVLYPNPTAISVGTMSIRSDNTILSRSGELLPYRP